MSILGGAECSTGSNPLSQFTKHVQDDKSLQRDRLVGQGPSGLQPGFRIERDGSSQDNVRSFFLPKENAAGTDEFCVGAAGIPGTE